MAHIAQMMMEQYTQCTREDNKPSLVRLTIPDTKNFELKGHILKMLKETHCYEKDNKDNYQHVDEVLEIDDYFNNLGVTKDVIMLRILVTMFKDTTRCWLKSLTPGTITTLDSLKDKIIHQFSPP